VYNRIVREFCDGRPLPLTISTTVDAPAGSGLGSSSALVVALVEGFRTFLDLPLGRYDVAHLAFEIERLDLGLAGGKQDQYAATFGGVNFIEFLAEHRVIVNPLRLSEAITNEFEASLVVCFTGVSRSSAEIISQQQIGIRDHNQQTLDALHQLKADTIEMKKALLTGDVPTVADVLLRSWNAKKRTAAPITTPHIDALFDLALSKGAIAGKVSGAGGGGFLMFLVPPDSRLKVINALNESGGRAGPAHLTTRGSETWASPAHNRQHLG
jgi:D-glycero-alpha-D-manno-heptose-7-phosphate kinase